MADNDQLLKQLNKRFDAIENNMATKQDIQRVEQNQAQTNDSLAHITTAVEAIAAGVGEIKETMATKADVQDVKAEVVEQIKDHAERIEELEKIEGIPHPHKH